MTCVTFITQYATSILSPSFTREFHSLRLSALHSNHQTCYRRSTRDNSGFTIQRLGENTFIARGSVCSFSSRIITSASKLELIRDRLIVGTESVFMSLTGIAALIATTLLWAAQNVGMKALIMSGMPPPVINVIRFTVASLPVIPFISRKNILPSALPSLMTFGGNLFLAMGLNFTSAGRVSFLASTSAIFVPFIQYFSKGMPILIKHIVASLMVMSGIFIITRKAIFSASVSAMGSSSLLGDLFALISPLIFSFYTVRLGSDSKKYELGSFVAGIRFWSMIFALVYTFSFGLFTQGMSSAIEAINVFSFVGIYGWKKTLTAISLGMAMFIAGFTQVWGQKRVTSTEAGIIFTSVPVWASIIAFVFLNEKLSLDTILGGLVITAGVLTGVYNKDAGHGNIKEKGIEPTTKANSSHGPALDSMDDKPVPKIA